MSDTKIKIEVDVKELAMVLRTMLHLRDMGHQPEEFPVAAACWETLMDTDPLLGTEESIEIMRTQLAAVIDGDAELSIRPTPASAG